MQLNSLLVMQFKVNLLRATPHGFDTFPLIDFLELAYLPTGLHRKFVGRGCCKRSEPTSLYKDK